MKTIVIDEDRCVGCGLCVGTCQQSALAMVDGKAKLVGQSLCDGIGNCLPACPVSAISFQDSEASPSPNGSCPSSLSRENAPQLQSSSPKEVPSQLRHWPVQLKLVLSKAPFLEQAKLLIAADCSAFTYGNFHQDFMKDRVTLIGCPKLDAVDYSEKLGEILKENHIQEIALVRMEVPCCGGLEFALERAIALSGKDYQSKVTILALDGSILS